MPGSRQQELLEGMVSPYEKLFPRDDVRIIARKDGDLHTLVVLVEEVCDTSIVCKRLDTIDVDVGIYQPLLADNNSLQDRT